MAKESLIAAELQRFEEKIEEFQMYLKQNTIITKVKDGKLKEADENNRHKEIDTQIKIMNNMPTWLSALSKLRAEEESKVIPTRGDVELNGMFQQKQQ